MFNGKARGPRKHMYVKRDVSECDGGRLCGCEKPTGSIKEESCGRAAAFFVTFMGKLKK